MKRLFKTTLVCILTLAFIAALAGCNAMPVNPEPSAPPASGPSAQNETVSPPEVPDAGVTTPAHDPSDPWAGLIIRLDGVGGHMTKKNIPSEALIDKDLLMVYIIEASIADGSDYYVNCDYISVNPDKEEIPYYHNNRRGYYRELGLVLQYIPDRVSITYVFDGRKDIGGSVYTTVYWSKTLDRVVTLEEIQNDELLLSAEYRDLYQEDYEWYEEKK